MGIVVEEVKVAAAGILLVLLISLLAYVLSVAFPAGPALYFFLWAFILVPVTLAVAGALAARVAYFACLGPNRSIAASVAVALVSAIAGAALWLLAGTIAGSPDFISRYFNDLDAGGYVELMPLLLVYALAGAIGGVYDYFISRGRSCEIRPGKGM